MTTNGRSTFKKSFWLICREHLSFIHYYQPLRPVWQRPEPSQATDVALERCIQGRFLGVVCHCLPPRLEVPTFATRLLGEKYGREFCLNFRFPRNIQGSFTCRKVRHGTDGFTSPPKEDVLRIFSPEKSDGFGRV